MAIVKGHRLMVAVSLVGLLATACGTSTGGGAQTIAGGKPASQANLGSPGPNLCLGKKYKIGFANLARDITFTIDVENGIKSAAQKTGCIDLVIVDNHLDGATALANADNLITQKVVGVVEFQTDEKFGPVIMSKFRGQNIPVVAIDIPMPGATFFGADNFKAGSLAGEAMAKAFQKKFPNAPPKLVLGELPQSGPVPQARMVGYVQGVKSVYPNLKDPGGDVIRFDSKNTLEESRTQMSNILQTLPPGTKFMAGAINDGSTLGELAAIQAAGRTGDAVLAGQGADKTGREEFCRTGSIMIGSTGYFPERYGDKIVPAILALVNGQALPPAVYVDHVFIDPKNIKQYYPDQNCPAAG